MSRERDPLDAVVRLREMAVDAARRGLAEALATETEAVQDVQEAEAAIAHETTAASQLLTTDADVEAFAAWLPQARQRLLRAEARHRAAAADTALARAGLARARSALEVAETLRERRAAAAREEAARRAQSELDDAALVRHISARS
ncbi:MAG TPA: flagellar FliJ family protein [Acetobacteraceae bacterium]|nr:flagellar FliJ family protein [Acetobacteraceae bacterium]